MEEARVLHHSHTPREHISIDSHYTPSIDTHHKPACEVKVKDIIKYGYLIPDKFCIFRKPKDNVGPKDTLFAMACGAGTRFSRQQQDTTQQSIDRRSHSNYSKE